MRKNLPVTRREYVYPDGLTIVSTTDLKGIITYCNSAFISISGYTREELIGKPHNMIRHPDVPPEAFRDLWDTIQKGYPWSGLVKNRRKNGDHYWVLANVTPLIEGGRPAGYMSVRTKPARASVEAAEALYARMRDEAASGRLVHRLRGAEVVRTDLAGKIGRMLGAVGRGRAMFPATAAALGAWALGNFGVALPVALSGAIALSAAQFVLTAGFMKRRLAALTSSANHIAAGDLTHGVDVGRRDSLGLLARALRQLGVNVHSLVNDAKTQVASMTVSTREIAAGNQDLATRTESQASSLEQTAAALDELTGTVRSNTDSASRAARLAGEATEITRASDQAVGSMAMTMKSIHEASKRIAEIVQVIEGISFQTNLLALNAAVEAARAGAHGRGFAIVAGEVRALSQRTSAASQEIKKLIADACERVDAGTREAGTARESIHGAVAAVEQVSTLVGAISVASNEQLTGISQVNEVVAHLDGITQHNAAMVEELTAAAASLAAGAQELSDAVEVFRIEAPGTKR